MNRPAVALALLLLAGVRETAVRADDGGLLHRLAGEVRARLAEASAARAPAIVPPVPVAIRWKPQKLGSLDLGAPLLAVTIADLDGDHHAELYAVTTREVIAISADRRLKELGRVAFAGDPAVVQPRDPVGTAVVDGGAVLASASPWARGLRVRWDKGALVGDPGEPDFVVCPGEHAQLAPGRNHFTTGTYGARCGVGLVDAKGAPLRVRAELALTGKLDVEVAGEHRQIADVGVAFDVADLDRDGSPELIFAGAGAPGDPDVIKVVPLTTGKPAFKKSFTAGGVAALAVGDVDGDRVTDVLAAVRLVGATRVDIWRLP